MSEAEKKDITPEVAEKAAQLSQAAAAFLVGDIPLRKRFIW